VSSCYDAKLGATGLRAALRHLLDTQLRPSPIGLHAPLQHSASAAQADPSALQATGRGSVDAVARLRWVKKAVTVRCEAAFCSSSHAAAGKTAMPTKSAKNIGKTVRPHDHLPLDTGFADENYTIPRPACVSSSAAKGCFQASFDRWHPCQDKAEASVEEAKANPFEVRGQLVL